MTFNAFIYWIVIPAMILVAPWLIARYLFVTAKSRQPYLRHARWLWVATIVWVGSFIVPNIPVTLESDSITMHTLGGVVSGLLAIYFIKMYDMRLNYWWQPLLIFYFLASGLGVANELLEFTINNTGLAYIKNGDITWDLTANTVGVAIVGAVWYLHKWLKEASIPSRHGRL